MKKTIYGFAFIFLPIFLFSQKIIVSGTVFNEKTKEVLIQATVKYGEKATVTDIDGKYQIELDKTGNYIVTVTYIGFNNFTKNVQITEGGASGVDFYISEGNTLLNVTTVTAGKFEKPLSEVTVSMDVLGPKLIENVNTRRVDDVLQKVPGVNIIDGQANIRGGSGWSYGAGSRVLLLVDDIPALQADAGFPNWTDIAVENIEQIEVVKGAASALYGSSAMNGIINIRTGFAKSEPETKFSTQYTGFLSPKDAKKKWWTKTPYDATMSLTHKQKFDKLDIVGTVFYYNQSNFRRDWYNKFGRFTTALRYRITDRLSIGVNANYNAGASQNYFYWGDSADSAYIGSPSAYSYSPNKTRFNIDPYLTYFDKYGNRHKVLTRFYSVDNQLNNNQSNSSKLFYTEYQFQRQIKNFVLTAGLVSTRTNAKAQLFSDTTFNSGNFAGYIQGDLKWGKLNLSGGFRAEFNAIIGPKVVKYSAFLAETTPNGGILVESKPVFRVGANYQLGQATFIRASWGQGYRFPTIAEMFISTLAGGIPIVPNPYLTSETGWTTEIGVKQGIKIGDMLGFADAALFWSEYANMMEFQFSNKSVGAQRIFGLQSQNVGDTRIKGFELSLAGQGKIGAVTPSVLIGYTYIDPKYKDFTKSIDENSSADYNVLKYRFKHNLKFDAETSYERVSLGLAVNYNSNMEAVDKIILLLVKGAEKFRNEHNKGFKTLDLRFSFKPIEKLKLTIVSANILNEEYSFRPGLLEGPRNISARVDWKF